MDALREEGIMTDLIWAATKLVKIRADFGNAPFTTRDLDRLYNILGADRFKEASKPSPKGEGVISD